jgi:hypothetical protein
MSAEEEVLAHLMTPMFKTEPAALGLMDAFKADILREAAALQRAALERDPGIFEGALIDLIDPDKDN